MAEREGPNGSTSKDRELQTLIERGLPGSRPETCARLADMARVRHVRSDDLIFRQGEPIPLTLLVRGYGAFRRTTVDGQHLTLGVANPGDLFGFTSVAASYASADMVALTAAEVATWRGPEIRRLVAGDSGFALDVIGRMSSNLHRLTEGIDGFMRQDARRRVVRVLARHADLFFSDPPVLLRSHLPSLVGTSREMTGRVLRDLERQGTLARVGRAGLKLLRPDDLEAEAAVLADTRTER